MSSGPFGTVLGVQFAAIFQSLLMGSRFQVALPAWAFCAKLRESRVISMSDRRNILGFIPLSAEKKRCESKHESFSISQNSRSSKEVVRFTSRFYIDATPRAQPGVPKASLVERVCVRALLSAKNPHITEARGSAPRLNLLE